MSTNKLAVCDQLYKIKWKHIFTSKYKEYTLQSYWFSLRFFFIIKVYHIKRLDSLNGSCFKGPWTRSFQFHITIKHFFFFDKGKKKSHYLDWNFVVLHLWSILQGNIYSKKNIWVKNPASCLFQMGFIIEEQDSCEGLGYFQFFIQKGK